MPYGYHGKILKVNLTSGAIDVDQHDETWYRRYLGGAGMSAYYLLKELAPGVEPLSPDNRLIIAPGVCTGVPISGFARNGMGAKSPMTGGIGKSEVGGYFGSELKRAGFDGIVIEGKAPAPTYLWIKDGAVELRDASEIWGKEVLETEEAIRGETGEKLARMAAIGPAGERLVRFACVFNDRRHAAGRGGMGAVMGSKNLKAIAARGTEPLPVADPATIKAMGKTMAASVPTKARKYSEFGTNPSMVASNLAGNIPTRNFQDGWFDEIESITAQAVAESIRIRMEGCYACAVRCKKVVKVVQPWVADPRYGGPEYETLAAFGSNCGIGNLKAIARAHHLCQAYGMDTISAGGTIAFAMECFEKGFLTAADLGGLDLTWGNADGMLELLRMIGERDGIGDLLAEGSRRAAEKLGGGCEHFALHVKGLELGMHEPRLKAGLGVGYCVANHGGDHGLGLHDLHYEKEGPYVYEKIKPVGVLEPMPSNELSTRKVNLFRQLHRQRLFHDSAVYCYFVPWTLEEIVRLVNATTGWNTTIEELTIVGERAITMGRAFNVREGFTPQDDRLPSRFFSPPLKGYLAERGQAVDPEAMAESVRTYYYLMGWNEDTGVPTRRTLERLEVEWVADELASRGIL